MTMEMDGDGWQRWTEMAMDGNGNVDERVEGNGLQWRWMAMEMAMNKRTAMDDNADGQQ